MVPSVSPSPWSLSPSCLGKGWMSLPVGGHLGLRLILPHTQILLMTDQVNDTLFKSQSGYLSYRHKPCTYKHVHTAWRGGRTWMSSFEHHTYAHTHTPVQMYYWRGKIPREQTVSGLLPNSPATFVPKPELNQHDVLPPLPCSQPLSVILPQNTLSFCLPSLPPLLSISFTFCFPPSTSLFFFTSTRHWHMNLG